MQGTVQIHNWKQQVGRFQQNTEISVTDSDTDNSFSFVLLKANGLLKHSKRVHIIARKLCHT